jgi:energy-converting hydrogenase Eha subunit F
MLKRSPDGISWEILFKKRFESVLKKLIIKINLVIKIWIITGG